MAQVSSLPTRTTPLSTDLLYLVDPAGGLDYKINLRDMNLAGANMALLGGDPTCSLANGVLQPITGWTSKGIIGDVSHDAGSGTITTGTSNGVYQLSAQIVCDWAVNGNNLTFYIQGTTLGDILLDNYAVASNNVDYSRVSVTSTAVIPANEILQLMLIVDGGAADMTIVAASFDLTQVLETA